MKRNYLFAATLVAAALASCSQDEHLDFANESKSGFTGMLETVDSRTALDENNKVQWNITDQITLFEGDDVNAQYKINSITDEGVANFGFVGISGTSTTSFDYNYAVYPYNSSNSISSECKISAPVSGEITIKSNASSIENALMVARTQGNSFKFTNAQGILVLRLNADRPDQYGKIQTIKLASKSNYLSGTATMYWNENGDAPEAQISEAGGSKELTVTLSEDLLVELPASTTGKYVDFYIPIVPTNFETAKDLSFTITGEKNKTYTREVNAAFAVDRSKIKIVRHTIGTNYDGVIDDNVSASASNAAELHTLLSEGKDVTLTTDIDLTDYSWTSITSYSGTLDGASYSIKNLKGENGLFETLDGATIKNLKIEDVVITANSNHTGALAGSIKKNENAQTTIIDNVTVSGTVTGSSYYTGGLIGAVSSYHAEITNCVNNATVTSAGQQVGGILGYAKRDALIEKCTNNGNITGEGFVGGIIGLIAGEDDDPSLYVTVKECTNTGTITGNGTPYGDYVGGIAGVVGREGGNSPVSEITAYIIDCTVASGQNILGGKINVATGKDELIVARVYKSTAYEGVYQSPTYAKQYYIDNKAGLLNLASAVKDVNIADEIPIKVDLMCDVDLAGQTWQAIDKMRINFNGNNHTVSNFIVNGDNDWAGRSGFFAYMGGSTISNLTLENVTSSGSEAGIFAGQSEGGDIVNCKIAGTNTVTWTSDTSDKTCKNGIGVFVGVSVESNNTTGEILTGTTVTLNYGDMYTTDNVWDTNDIYVGGLYTESQSVTVTNNGTIKQTINANDAKTLATALSNGNTVVLTSDVEAPLSNSAIYGTPVAVIQKGGVFDGNGYSLDIENPQYNGYAVETYGGTIKNLTIDTTVGRGIVISSPTEDIYIDNVVINGPGYALNTTEHNGKKLVVTNSTLKGWTSFAGLESASFINCTFGENTSKYWQNNGYDQDYDRLIRPYITTTFTSCTFEKDFYIDLSALGTDAKITLKDCVCGDVEITADNYTEYITIELPEGRTLDNCVVFE